MNLLSKYDLYLFDFDGLLINSELLHYEAYKKMCHDRGFDLDWSFDKYIKIAHYSSEGLSSEIYSQFPELERMESDWSVLYQEKKQAVMQIYRNQLVPLMPGAADFVDILADAGKKMAVVTNSPKELVDIVRERDPLLSKIPYWITREQYCHAKPDPECYLYAIKKLSPNGHVIGFEDTPRGIQALRGTSADPVIVTDIPYPELPQLIREGVAHFSSFNEVIDQLIT